jgi:hypothetical protein
MPDSNKRETVVQSNGALDAINRLLALKPRFAELGREPVALVRVTEGTSGELAPDGRSTRVVGAEYAAANHGRVTKMETTATSLMALPRPRWPRQRVKAVGVRPTPERTVQAPTRESNNSSRSSDADSEEHFERGNSATDPLRNRDPIALMNVGRERRKGSSSALLAGLPRILASCVRRSSALQRKNCAKSVYAQAAVEARRKNITVRIAPKSGNLVPGPDLRRNSLDTGRAASIPIATGR